MKRGSTCCSKYFELTGLLNYLATQYRACLHVVCGAFFCICVEACYEKGKLFFLPRTF